MKINNVELDIDFTDADLIEKIDEGNKIVQKEIKELEKNKNKISPAEGIRQECKIVKDFLDYVFGEGISKQIFGEKDSLRECLRAFEDIIEERNRQMNNFNDTIAKYSPDRLKR